MKRPINSNGRIEPGTPGSGYALLMIAAMQEGHAVGTSPKDGSLVMRGLQIAGAASRPLPQWTLFSINKVEMFEARPQVSLAPREGYAMNDKGMNTVIAELQL